MPRKKKHQIVDESISVLQPEIEPLTEPTIEPELATTPLDESVDPESCNRNYLTATIQSAQTSMSDLFETQAQLAGTQIADKVFDQLEDAFVSRLQQRLQPFVDSLLPEIRESHVELQQRTKTRVERRQAAFTRIRQIATLISDECRLSLPSHEPTGNLLGFASWDVSEGTVNHD